jgi:hypothetical protein
MRRNIFPDQKIIVMVMLSFRISFVLLLVFCLAAAVSGAETTAPRTFDVEWVDDFSADTSNSYNWIMAHHPTSIPGGDAYAKYHHDSRYYSFTKTVEDGKLLITTDYWFLGRIYGYKSLHFHNSAKKIQINAYGHAARGDYEKYPPWGLAVYATESDLLQDINQYPSDPTRALVMTEGVQGFAQMAQVELAAPIQDCIVVLYATDSWATSEYPKCQVYASFDQIEVHAITSVAGGTTASVALAEQTFTETAIVDNPESSDDENEFNYFLVLIPAAMVIGGLLFGMIILRGKGQNPPRNWKNKLN